MTRSTWRAVVVGIAVTLIAAGCGDNAANPERFCAIDAEMDQLGDPLEAEPEEARALFDRGIDLLHESISVAPDEIRASVATQVEAFTPMFDLFESVDFDVTQLDEAEIDAVFEAAFSGDNAAAFDVVEDWIDANCST